MPPIHESQCSHGISAISFAFRYRDANIPIAADCATEGTLTITATADAAAISGCSTYDGSLAVNTELAVAKDQNGRQTLAISGVKEVTGNITVTQATNLASLSFDSLQTVGGIELGDLTVLSELSAPQLTKVDTLNFTALPALQSMSFGNKGVTEAISVLITNTGLGSLQGINNLESIEIFNVNNNQALTNISLDVKQIKRSLDIEANDGYVSGLAVSFPFLENALNMTFRNCSSVDLSALAVVNQSLGFYGNSFENFTAPNLTQAGGLIFVDNTELTNITLPKLQTINQLYQIANNTMLKKINGFEKLATVSGALDFNGNFTEYVHLARRFRLTNL